MENSDLLVMIDRNLDKAIAGMQKAKTKNAYDHYNIRACHLMEKRARLNF